MFAPSDTVLSHMLVVLGYDDDAHFGLLSGGIHWWWVASRGSTLETRLRYIPTDGFETFPQPNLTDAIASFGEKLNEYRSALMLDRLEGLTKTYNRVHDPDESSDDITHLREIHVELDYAVRDAYGWTDLDLCHDFRETRFGTRFTFAPVPRQEVLDRLLELNHDRYAEEVAQGLHAKPKTKGKGKPVHAAAMTLGFDGV
jgi:hypothetical protein